MIVESLWFLPKLDTSNIRNSHCGACVQLRNTEELLTPTRLDLPLYSPPRSRSLLIFPPVAHRLSTRSSRLFAHQLQLREYRSPVDPHQTICHAPLRPHSIWR